MKNSFDLNLHQLLTNADCVVTRKTIDVFRSFFNSAITCLEKKFDSDENSTFGKLSNLSLAGNFLESFVESPATNAKM